ncbi:DNA repair protein RecN-like [Rhinoderma darwinii]|uniref:DNA repair protein RecN-like n=1 Tax=Rhinoderma darwinii TaxID=43563 RepID=UPI003F66408A
MRFLQEKNIESTNELILRREINPATKTSRNFINDSLVSATELGEVAKYLIDLHRQFDTLEIYSTDFQFKIVDAVANNFDLLAAYQKSFYLYIAEKKHLETLQSEQLQSKKDLEYYTYLNEELENIHFKDNEIETIEEELQTLTNAENTQLALASCTEILYNTEHSIHYQLRQCVHQLKQLKINSPQIEELNNRLNSCYIEVEDIYKETSNLSQKFNPNPERLQFLSDRLSEGYKLLKKHQVKSTQELLAVHKQIQDKLNTIQNIDQILLEKNKAVEKLHQEIELLAENLHQVREKNIAPFLENLHLLLHKVGMPNAQFKINLDKGSFNEYGKDTIEFLLDANRTNAFKSLKKVGSGGELNRLMLSIKSIVATSLELPTLIFDEIDTGVSGEVAKQIGEILKSLAIDIQIICITHQASIAAKGNAHLFVYKQEKNQSFQTDIKLLNKDERVIEIAEMLGGEIKI